MRRGILVVVALAVLVAVYAVARANERDGVTLTVEVRSADHELAEGYFSLGDDATIVAKPGSSLHRFLSRQRGQPIVLTLTKGATRELSRLDRAPK